MSSANGNYKWRTLSPSTFPEYIDLPLDGLCGCACNGTGLYIYLMDTSGYLLILVL